MNSQSKSGKDHPKKQPLIWAVTFLDCCAFASVRFSSACVCVYTNQELWKGQTATFCLWFWAEMRHDVCHMMEADYMRTRLPVHSRLPCSCGFFWPLFFDPALLSEIQAEKFFIFALPPLSASSFYSHPPVCTTLPLTPARGHPPADGTSPVPFDTEFAL